MRSRGGNAGLNTGYIVVLLFTMSSDLTEACEQGVAALISKVPATQWAASIPSFSLSLRKLVFGDVLLQKNHKRNNSPTSKTTNTFAV